MPIIFNAIHRVLLDDDRLRPKLASEVLPEWKADIPAIVRQGIHSGRTVKACPGIDDYLHLGYVIPFWTDARLTRMSIHPPTGRPVADPVGKRIHVKTPAGVPPLEFHGIDQVKGVEPLEPPLEIEQLVKPACPWFIETPPGWSILILPMFFHETRNRTPLQPIPGVINTDYWHQINTACRWNHVEPVMEMKAGTPFMHVIPFRRSEALEAEFRVIGSPDKWQSLVGYQADFSGSYRRQQRNFEKAVAPPDDTAV